MDIIEKMINLHDSFTDFNNLEFRVQFNLLFQKAFIMQKRASLLAYISKVKICRSWPDLL